MRRTIGLKKDEYSLDRKTVTKVDVMNLLQAAGFSRSNPYYIVPQGRITALTNARDSERLELLKEVAGTRVYEDHRQESLKILEETALKQTKIRELLVFIDERLGELAEEKEELLRFQALDRQKRATEYALITREQSEIEEALAKLEEERPNEEAFGADSADFERQLEAIAQLERELGNQRQALAEAEREAEAARIEVDELQKVRAQLTVAVSDWTAGAAEKDSQVAATRASLTRVEREIERKQGELEGIMPRLSELTAALDALKAEISECTAQEESLKARQGRFSQFSSARERDAWIRKQLETLAQTAQLLRDQASEADSSLAQSEAQVGELLASVAELEKSAQEASSGRDGLNAAIAEAKKARDLATDARKDLWRAEGKVQAALESIKEQVNNAERTLAGSLDRSTWSGLDAMKRVIEASPDLSTGVLGCLYELFTVPDSLFRPAVEAVAGGTLFNVVTRDDRTATTLLQSLAQTNNRARLTCIPLNRISSSTSFNDSDAEDDQVDTSALPRDCIALLEKLEFDPELAPVMQSIFGRAVVVPGLGDRELLREVRARGFTAITLDGDRVDVRGAIFGGSRTSDANGRPSRLEAAARLISWRRKEAEQRSLLADLQSRLALADEHVTRAVASLTALEQQRSLASAERILATLATKQTELEAARQLHARRQESRASIEEELQNIHRETAQLQSELGQPLQALTPTERKQLASLSEQLQSLNARLQEQTGAANQLQARQAQLEALLEENLRRRRLELLTRLAEAASVASAGQNGDLQAQLQSCSASLAESQNRLDEALAARASAQSAIVSFESSLDRARATSEALIKESSIQGSTLERYLTRRSVLLQRQADASRRARELGIMTGDAEMEAVLARVRDLSTPALIATLADASAAIKAAFGSTTRAPPNRKAVELHASFTRQAEALEARERELDASANSITEFIALLDQRKDEAIMRTFEQVKENFARVFERLCPSGHAELVMLRADQSEVETPISTKKGRRKSETAPITANQPTSMQFLGVQIKASFASKNASEGLLIGQLSGGQKSLLALALIFAIQLVDPAPFYLFDEIDANLDAAARAAVADLIHTLADPVEAGSIGGANARAAPPAQFITTTFRPELLRHADSFFGVSFAGRVSRVDQITPEQAMQFIEHSSI